MSLWSFQSVCWPPICICSTSIYLCKLLLIYVNVIFKWHSQAVKVIFFTKDTDMAAASWRAGKRLNPSAFYRYLTFPFSISWFACRRARVLHQTLIHDTGSLSSEQCRTWLPCGIKSTAKCCRCYLGTMTTNPSPAFVVSSVYGYNDYVQKNWLSSPYLHCRARSPTINHLLHIFLCSFVVAVIQNSKVCGSDSTKSNQNLEAQ